MTPKTRIEVDISSAGCARVLTLGALFGLALLLSACSNDSSCPECGRCAMDELLDGDIIDARPVYAATGEPVVIVRLDVEGTCAGSGANNYVLYDESGLTITTDEVALDPDVFPEHEPGSTEYLYRTDMLTVEVRRAAGADLTLAFMGASAVYGLRCTSMEGVLDCAEL